MEILELKNIDKIYRTGKVEVHALKNINLTIEKGEFTGIVGPSGSGKTTLLNIMGLIDRPTKGTVVLEGRDLTGKKSKELALLRRHYFGFIFQNFNLIPVFTVFENVELALTLKYKHLSKKEKELKIMETLESVGIEEKRDAKPLELSGGEQQRVSIARALVKDPDFVLADEPTANLDSKTGEQIVELMKTLNRDKKTTFVFSTHDPLIIKYAKRIINLRDGMIKGEKDV